MKLKDLLNESILKEAAVLDAAEVKKVLNDVVTALWNKKFGWLENYTNKSAGGNSSLSSKEEVVQLYLSILADFFCLC